MSARLKLRWMSALMLVFIAVFSVQMGIFVTRQVGESSLKACIMLYWAFDLIIAYTLIRVTWRITAQAYLSRKWNRLFGSMKHDKLTKALNYKYRSLGTEIIVVQDEAFVALAMGMLKPKIIISTHVLEQFSDKEVKAILLHEWHHCRNRDNVKLFLMTLFTEAFGYWPIMKPIFRYYETWTELLADRFVMTRMGTELHLAKVLLKLSKWGKIQPAVAVHFAASALNYRMMQVLEPNETVKVKIALLRPLLFSISMLLLLMLGGDT
ncbi:M56 family metallopeptidase [Paenibacillus agri]|uniref:M56 family metallopeptidase n=1 Tax=Paenibacillus agri TaxID=2744309 RepID=A0A850F312_9BACL|nr:M56 family metallopeptidase [Paenibacillus agri]NUU64401.1 M56 family metallopeptidase [Paenibacillus agri]